MKNIYIEFVMTPHELHDNELQEAKVQLQSLVANDSNIFVVLDSTRSVSQAIDAVTIEAGNSPE